MAVQYHLYHERQYHPRENLDLFAKVKLSATPFTPYGIIKEK
jgi:hypothetical protein